MTVDLKLLGPLKTYCIGKISNFLALLWNAKHINWKKKCKWWREKSHLRHANSPSRAFPRSNYQVITNPVLFLSRSFFFREVATILYPIIGFKEQRPIIKDKPFSLLCYYKRTVKLQNSLFFLVGKWDINQAQGEIFIHIVFKDNKNTPKGSSLHWYGTSIIKDENRFCGLQRRKIIA